MENASKAIIMAGGVLIAVAVISLALYAYANFKGYAESSEEMLTASQIESFNRFYESYRNSSGIIRGIDVVNVINKAVDDELITETDAKNIIPSELQDEGTQATAYLKEYGYSIDYDFQGKVSSITISR